MTDREPTQDELEEQNGEPSPTERLTHAPDADAVLDVPKVAEQEPGLPPPRD